MKEFSLGTLAGSITLFYNGFLREDKKNFNATLTSNDSLRSELQIRSYAGTKFHESYSKPIDIAVAPLGFALEGTEVCQIFACDKSAKLFLYGSLSIS